MKIKGYFSRTEISLWCSSLIMITISFLLFDRENYLTLMVSCIGVTSLILNAKGNPIGQFLMIVFSILYGIISYSREYYGEMITYLGMTAPMALMACISWLKNPYNNNRSEVRVGRISTRETVFVIALTALVTVIFYFILGYFNTAYLFISTVSVTTSFLAVYLTFRRSPYFAICYAANDIVLIILWVLASLSEISYISVVICFLLFLINDVYGFISWLRMQKRQEKSVD